MHPKAHEINQSIHLCLDACVESDVPIARLAEVCDKLRGRSGWTKADVLTVETAVRRMLAAILDRPDGDQIDSRPGSATTGKECGWPLGL
jgi:hypothetical protein